MTVRRDINCLSGDRNLKRNALVRLDGIVKGGDVSDSCMTVTLHTGEALVLIHSHANSEKARTCINTVACNTVL